jgi:hypothetical protein
MASAKPCFQLGFFFGILLGLLTSRYPYTHAQNVSIDDTSPRWNFTPPVCADICDGINSSAPRAWYVRSVVLQLLVRLIRALIHSQVANCKPRDCSRTGGFLQFDGYGDKLDWRYSLFRFLWCAFTSFCFFASFIARNSGTAVYYYALLSPWGGNMTITIDGESHNVTTQLPKTTDSEQRQHLVYYSAGLNGSVEHKLTVRMSGGYSIDVDRVDITPLPNASGSIWPQVPSTTTGSTLVHQSGPTASSTDKGPVSPITTKHV